MPRTLTCLLAVAGLASLLLPHALAAQGRDASPNVVLIMSDQMRGDALSTLGSPNARTPHLDRMASEGVLFANHFANNPVCVPSRMSIHTGLYPHQHGTISNRQREFIQSPDSTLLGYFHERGYRLGWFGKDYHAYEQSILDSLLDANEGRGREPFKHYTRYVMPYWHGDMYWPTDQLNAYKTTRDGVGFLEEASADEPFFLVLNYYDPHPPYFAPAEYAQQYDEMTVPPYVAPEKLSGRLAAYQQALRLDEMKRSELTATMTYYYAAIEWGVDKQVGNILQTLKDQGLSEDTIVLFTSEHGDFMGDYNMVRKGMFLYDALLHVPLIWYAPGRIESGLCSEAMTQGVDLLPTLIDLTGGDVPEALPGRSLKPLLQGQAEAQDETTVYAAAGYSELPTNYFDDPVPPPFELEELPPFHSRIYRLTWQPEHRTVMARTQEWKLILSETRPPELYPMNGMWTEKENVAGDPEYSDVLDTLRTRIEQVWPTWAQQAAGER